MTIKTAKLSIAELRARWTLESIEKCCFALEKTGTAASPFGHYEGLEDFRGFSLSVGLDTTTVALAGKRPIPRGDVPPISNLDFSFANFKRGGFEDVVAENCKFDGVVDCANWRRVYRCCSFIGTKMARNYFTGRFEDCDFSKAELNSSSAGATDSFVRCNFTKANFRSANWVQVRFENCTFDGAKFDRASVSGSRFIGAAPSEEQLKDTLIAKVVYEDVPGR